MTPRSSHHSVADCVLIPALYRQHGGSAHPSPLSADGGASDSRRTTHTTPPLHAATRRAALAAPTAVQGQWRGARPAGTWPGLAAPASIYEQNPNKHINQFIKSSRCIMGGNQVEMLVGDGACSLVNGRRRRPRPSLAKTRKSGYVARTGFVCIFSGV